MEELFKGRDGIERGVLVRLVPKNGKQSLLYHPIQLLYPLEIHQEIDGRLSTIGKKNTIAFPDT